KVDVEASETFWERRRALALVKIGRDPIPQLVRGSSANPDHPSKSSPTVSLSK
ncbi:11738_t:CDS:2, partial [Entrophospora sp. SA101]